MPLCRFAVPLVASLALAACAGPAAHDMAAAVPSSDLDAVMYGPPPGAPHVIPAMPVRAAMPENSGPYTLDAGDKVRVVVFGQDNLSNSYTVDAGGHVTLPLIGAVRARGSTTQQLAGSIAGRLKESYIREPSVAVEVEVYRPFFVLGEVTYPGQYPYVPDMTVEKAISIAGGYTPRATKDPVTVTRKVGGVSARHALPVHSRLRPGDVITVSERWF
jgi:polysaccharide export outer membrane protein